MILENVSWFDKDILKKTHTHTPTTLHTNNDNVINAYHYIFSVINDAYYTYYCTLYNVELSRFNINCSRVDTQ